MADAQLPKDSEHGEGDVRTAAPPPHPLSATLNGHHPAGPSFGEDGKPHVRVSEADETDNVIILPPPVSAPILELSSWAYHSGDIPPAGAPDFTGVLPAVPPQRKLASLMEISPIFSALDAADGPPTSARPQPATPPLIDAFELGIVVPPARTVPYRADIVTSVAYETSMRPLPDEPLACETASADPSPETPPALSTSVSLTRADDVPPETAERIAAEANATAAALEALKQLLVEKLPALEAAAARQAERNETHAGDRPFHPLARMPVAPPVMLPAHLAAASLPNSSADEPPRRTGAMVGSFFAGFSLSWVLGAVLYIYLTTG